MSKEMRKQIDRVKNFKQFLNENKTEQYENQSLFNSCLRGYWGRYNGCKYTTFFFE